MFLSLSSRSSSLSLSSLVLSLVLWVLPHVFACEPFQYDESLSGWRNTTCEVYDTGDIEKDRKTIAYAFDSPGFTSYRHLVGNAVAIASLDILERLQCILWDIIKSHGDEEKHDQTKKYHEVESTQNGPSDYLYRDLHDYNQQIISFDSEDGAVPTLKCKDSDTVAEWMKCHLQAFLMRVNGYTAAVTEYFFGLDTSPPWAFTMWSTFRSPQLRKAAALSAAAKQLKSGSDSRCRSSFVITDENMGLVTPGGGSEPAMLIGVIPRRKGTGSCKSEITEAEIIEDLVKLLSFAGQKLMVAFCLTLTGPNGWFGSNNWFGQVKFFPMKDAGQISYANMPCKELSAKSS